jgi:hypothetical protein
MVDTDARVHIEIDGRDFVLGDDRDLTEVMAHIEAAAASPPAFVHLSTGDQMVAVLIHSRSRVVITTGDASPGTATPEVWDSMPDWEL